MILVYDCVRLTSVEGISESDSSCALRKETCLYSCSLSNELFMISVACDKDDSVSPP